MQPLGPGYRFVDRKTEIRAVGDSPGGAGIHVRINDRFENTGDRSLHSMEVRLPEGPTFPLQNLRMTINGHEVPPQRASDADHPFMHTLFDPVWQQHQSREIATEWDLMADSAGGGTAGSSAVAFYVADETALPLWQAPSGVFARGGPDPMNASLTVIAPADFRVLAPGKPLKPGTVGKLVAHHFQIRLSDYFLPYVVAGRYSEQKIQTSQGEVNFWTLHPLDGQQAQTAAVRLAASVGVYTDFFGPVSKNKLPMHIVEAPGDIPGEFEDASISGGAPFPWGVLLDHRAFAQGLANESILELAEYELARTWFGWRVRPSPESQILMGRGAGLFGLVVAAEERGADQRQHMVTSLLNRYDESRRIAADRRLLELPVVYSRAESISTGYRAALFFVALEDLCGRDNLRAAFQQIVRARGGDEVTHQDLRAALEATFPRDLAPMFRRWLNRPGVPDEFRTHYANSAGMAGR